LDQSFRLAQRWLLHDFIPSQMGTDDPINLGLAEKSKNLASLLAEFLFYPAPFA
jgi:hypothetical protein